MKIKLEVCCDNVQSVKIAVNAGADRIELCSALCTGGLTPSLGFVEACLQFSTKPINVLIRPREGNFVYSDEEFKIICEDIKILKQVGVNGIVSGILTENGEVDYERTAKILELSKNLDFTFHRAIDFTQDYEQSLHLLSKLGIKLVLSSGSCHNLDEGYNNIISLHNKFKDIAIMPGGGLNENNAIILLKNGIKQFHFSATKFSADNIKYKRQPLGLGYNFADNNSYGLNIASEEKIKQMLKLLK